jgi:hypothetical protein
MMILTCGCQVANSSQAFAVEWEGYSRESEPAIFYGVLCADHVKEYDATIIETVEDKEWNGN